MNILIAGLGSIGRRHFSNLGCIEPGASITIWHLRSRSHDPSDLIASTARHVYSLEEALETKPHAGLITSPASFHIPTAMALAREGVHLFIEKPLSHSLDGINDLLDLCRHKKLILMVGYNFRFYRPLQLIKQSLEDGAIGRPLSLRAAVGQFLPDWRYNVDYRQTASARAETGGGAVLELSHEIDYARWLMGEPQTVFARTDRLSDLDLDVEDSAEVIMTFANGDTGNIHLDMIDRASTRNCRITGTEGTITWDGLTHQVRLWSAANNEWQDLHPASEIDRNAMYVAELNHFLTSIETGQTPEVTGEDGKRVVEIAEAIKRSSIEQRVISL